MIVWEGRSIYIYMSKYFTVAPVRQEICRYRWKKSTKAFESKMRQSSLGIYQSCSNRSRVQIILHSTLVSKLLYRIWEANCLTLLLFRFSVFSRAQIFSPISKDTRK